MTTSHPVTGTPPIHPTPATGGTSTDRAPRHLGLVPPAAPGAVDGPPDPDRILGDEDRARARRAARWWWPALACSTLLLPGVVLCVRWDLPAVLLLVLAPPILVPVHKAQWRRADDETLMTVGPSGRIRALRFDDVVDAWVAGGPVCVRDKYGTPMSLGPGLAPESRERVRQALLRQQAETGRPLNRAAAAALGVPVLPGAPREHRRVRMLRLWTCAATLVLIVALAWLARL